MTRRARIATGTLVALLLALAALAPVARAQGPSGEAGAAVVVEASSGKLVYGKNPDQQRAIGSTTKLMTALLVLERGDLSKVVTVGRYRGSPAESLLTPPLVPGERMTVADLVRGLLLTSANDAAQALAIEQAGSVPAFVRQMNRRAQQLGMRNTNFGNPIGLDTGDNHSSARDLAKLALALRENRFFSRVVNSSSLTLRSGGRTRTIDNRNDLLGRYGWVNGVKTGYTSQAGYCMVASGRKRGVSIVAVELGAPSEQARDDVSLALLNYGFNRFSRKTAIERGEVVARVPIEDRPGATLPLVASRTVRSVVGREERFVTSPDVPETVTGPIESGDEVGKLVITASDGGRRIATIPLRASLAVPAASAARKVQDSLLGPWTLLVVGGVLLSGAALALLRRGPPRRGADRLGEAGQT